MDKSPAFQFYPRDFLVDEHVMRMGNAELGIYIRLLCLCWLEGSIPADVAEIALMLRTPKREIEKAWGVVGRCFAPAAIDGRLVQPRLERERAAQAERRERAQEKARNGGFAKSKKRQFVSSQEPAPSSAGQLLDTAPCSPEQTKITATALLETSTASATASAASATALSAREAELALDGAEARHAQRSEAMLFGEWFFAQGIMLGDAVIPASWAIDPGPGGFALTHREKSAALIDAYGIDECKRRALNLLARKARTDEQRLRFAASPKTLHERWDWFDTAEPPSRRPAPRTYDRSDISGGTDYAALIAAKKLRVTG